MREIIFRGKRLDNEEWVYGDLFRHDDGRTEIFEHKETIFAGKNLEGIWHEVNNNTVGQCTLIEDIFGKKIFEGDIVKFKYGGGFGPIGIYRRNYAVEFVNTYVNYGLQLRNKSIHFLFRQGTDVMHDVVIIGNIHDNYELLEEEDHA